MPIKWFTRDDLDEYVKCKILETDVVLDIGPGIRPQTFFHPDKEHICIEPHPEYVEVIKGAGLSCIQDTAQHALPLLQREDIDTVFLLDVIEHLEKAEGQQVLEQCERLADKQIVVFTPLGFLEQSYREGEKDAWGLFGGVWQHHRSGWGPEDFGVGWDIYACKHYHEINGKGETLDPPAGAFYAIRTKDYKRTVWTGEDRM